MGDIIFEVADRKRRASVARSATDIVAERPREVFQAACDHIGTALAPLGFRYAPSSRHARRTNAPLIHEVAMGSSHNNVAGEYVSIDLVTLISSRQFAQWRARQPAALSTASLVARTNVGYLLDPPGFVEWNLADPATRGVVVHEIVEVIKTAAAPWFAVFDDREALVAALRSRSVQGLDPGTAVEILLWLGEHAAAVEHARIALDANPAMAARYDVEAVRIARDGLAREYDYNDDGPALAYAVAAHHLEVPRRP